MADQPRSDIVMRFVTKDNNPVSAECALDKDSGDDYMTDFTPQTYQDYSNFFEVTKFGFQFEVKDEDQSKNAGATKGAQPSKAQGTSSPRGTFSLVAGEFASWRSATENEAPNMLFPLQFDSFKFDRLIDAASPIFFKYCVTSKSFDSAYLVKRVSQGGTKSPAGFLRLEFKNVLITSLSWDDGDMTTEKCEFICRDFTLKYRQQQASGAWGATASASWNYQTNALPTRK